jgi:hypothetical protein
MAPPPSTNAAKAEAAQTSIPSFPQFPPHKEPRVWFLTDGLSPIAISLSRCVLQHGDYVISGILPTEFRGARGDQLREFMEDVVREGLDGNDADETEMDIDPLEDADGSEEDSDEGQEMKRPPRKRWRERFKVVALDGR